MLATLYLCIVIFFGISFVNNFVNVDSIFNVIAKEKFSKTVPRLLFIIPAGICVGILIVSIFNYFAIYAIQLISKNIAIAYPLGITITAVIFSIITIFNIYKMKHKKIEKIKYKKIYIIYYSVISFIIVSAVSFIMIYTYRTNGNEIVISQGVYSDLVIHTSITSSFGVGGNIPTSYTYFSGDGMNWHFFLYFFSGILNYLGLPVVYAINISSIVTMSCALVLLGLISSLLAKNRLAFILAPIFVFFRSALNFFLEIQNLIEHKLSLKNIFLRKDWSDIEPYGSWGFGTLNIYSNQRHFMIGMSAILILTILFLPYVIEFIEELKKSKNKIKDFICNKNFWKIDMQDKRLIVAILVIIALPYFHGSALISSLLLLGVFAIFSKNRLAYLLLAIIAVVFSVIQTNIFSGSASNVLKIKFEYGYVLGQVSLKEILYYIFIITGYISIVCLLSIVTHKKEKLLYTVLFVSFITSLVFAFTFKTTIEMQNNHKFVQFSIILLNILVSGVVANLLNNVKVKSYLKILSFFLGIIFVLILTSTGIMDFCTFINRNKLTVSYNTKSEMVEWIKENTDTDDVFLTPLWIGHEFFLSGRCAFLGYKYYPWTAGYDTNTREKEYRYLLTGANDNKEEFVELCKKHNIKYIIDHGDLLSVTEQNTEKPIYNRKFVEKNFEKVGSFNSSKAVIYKVYE